MNKTSKPISPPSTTGEIRPNQPLSTGKKLLLSSSPSAPQAKPETTAKSAAAAAERDKKLDLILHRFAKLL